MPFEKGNVGFGWPSSRRRGSAKKKRSKSKKKATTVPDTAESGRQLRSSVRTPARSASSKRKKGDYSRLGPGDVPGWLRARICEAAEEVGTAKALEPFGLHEFVSATNVHDWRNSYNETDRWSPLKPGIDYVPGPERTFGPAEADKLLDYAQNKDPCLTQTGYAERMGMSQATVSRTFGPRQLERGLSPLTRKKLYALQAEGNLPRIYDMHLSFSVPVKRLPAYKIAVSVAEKRAAASQTELEFLKRTPWLPNLPDDWDAVAGHRRGRAPRAVVAVSGRQCKCGSTTHSRTSHGDCRLNPKRTRRPVARPAHAPRVPRPRVVSPGHVPGDSSDEEEPCDQTYDDLSEDDDVTGFEDSEEEEVVIEPARTRARVVIVPPVDALEIVEAEPMRRSCRRSNTAR